MIRSTMFAGVATPLDRDPEWRRYWHSLRVLPLLAYLDGVRAVSTAFQAQARKMVEAMQSFQGSFAEIAKALNAK